MNPAVERIKMLIDRFGTHCEQAAIFGFTLMMLWNWFLMTAFGWRHMTFLAACALVVIGKFILNFVARETKPFPHVLMFAPPIHVLKNAADGKPEVTLLRAQPIDSKYSAIPYSIAGGDKYSEGTGTKEDPFRYRSAAPVSAHYGVIDLWYCHRSLVIDPKAPPVYLQVNDWLLKIDSAGVTAENNHFTRLLPGG